MRKVCIVVTARPSWAKLEPVCRALKARPDVELQIVACASALLERYGNVSQVIEAQGYSITEKVWSTYEGANLITSAKETGALLHALADVLHRLRPDVVCVCADRHEVLAAAQAASYLHLSTAHVQGGEKTGSIDDRVRDSITALADLHFPATEQAAFRVYSLTGAHGRIWNVGCPSIDVARQALSESPVTAEELGGAGAAIDLAKPFGVILQHPVTNEAERAYNQIAETLIAIDVGDPLPPQWLVLWPGQDAGSEAASKAIRENHGWLHTVRNLPPNRFLRLLTQASVLVGNSSAGIRESAYLGVPVVDIGSRQQGRERASNVVWAPHDADQIARAIQQQIAHGPYLSSTLYGSGDAGERIAEVLADVTSHRIGASPIRIERLSRQKSARVGRFVAD